MSDAVQFLFIGLGLAGVYGIAALGLVLVYRGSGVVNFAHGGIALLGGLAMVETREQLGTWPAVAFGVLVGAAIGAAIELLVMRRLRGASPVSRLIATLALLAIAQQAVTLTKGTTAAFVEPILPTDTIQLGEVSVGADRMILFAILVVLVVVLAAAGRTRPGLALAAVAENRRAAAALGHSPDAVAVTTWALGGALAALAGILVAPLTSLSPGSTPLLVIPALAAALVGRLVSLPLMLAGAVLVGVGEAEATRYITAPGWANSVPFLIIFALVLVRRDSLPSRSAMAERLPRVPASAGHPAWWAAWMAAAIAALTLLDGDWPAAIVLTAAAGTIALSVVVLTGFGGQLSLAQFALAGIGALVAGRLVDGAGLGFLPAFMCGVLAAAAVGVAVGLPALRTRGVTLAIVTLGLGTIISSVVFSNPDYTGGPITGTTLDPPQLVGFDVSYVAHPERYGLMCLAVLSLAALAAWNLRRSPVGRQVLAVRANERAAASLGVPTAQRKLLVFCVSSAMAGAGGVLLAFRNTRLDLDAFSFAASNEIVLLTVLGGVGFLAGGAVGGAVVSGGVVQTLLGEVTDVSEHSLLVSAIVVLVVLMAFPDGVAAAVQRLGRRRRATAAPMPAIASGPGRAAPAPLALEVRGLRVRFGGVVAVDGVDLDVRPGEVLGLIGPNGAGKSTIIDAISGQLARYEGAVRLGDRVLDGLRARERADAGLGRSFQSLELFEDLTVLENIRVAADRVSGADVMRSLVAPRRPPLDPATWAVVEELGLTDRIATTCADLPYAQRRLTAVARAVARGPSVLCLDEPAAGLDTEDRRHLVTVIRGLAERGMGVLLVEHDVDLVMRTCDAIVVLEGGRVIARGAPEDVRHDPAVVAAYLGSAEEREPAATTAQEAGA